MTAALCPFAVPIINDNDDGWGPPLAGVPNEKLAEIPYAPFSKSDKVGKSADWQGGQRNFQQSMCILFHTAYHSHHFCVTSYVYCTSLSTLKVL